MRGYNGVRAHHRWSVPRGSAVLVGWAWRRIRVPRHSVSDLLRNDGGGVVEAVRMVPQPHRRRRCFLALQQGWAPYERDDCSIGSC